MRRIKGFLALMLMLLMAIGMTITASAADSTITISGLSEGALVTYKQIVVADNTSTSGWKAVDATVQAALETLKTSADQDVFAAYEAATKNNQKAIMDAFAGIATSETDGVNGNRITVSSPGLYLINATDPTGKWIYKPMIAGIGFDYENGAATMQTAVTVVAKKGPNKVEKTASGEFVEINDILDYTITTTIPYIPSGSTETPKFAIKDTLTGGEYVLTNDQFVLTYKIGDGAAQTKVVEVTTTNDGKQTFTANFDELTANNNNANAEIVFSYQAKVTDVAINNEAVPFTGGHVGEVVVNRAVTGEIEATKVGDNGELLSGAQFVIVKGEQFATLDNSNKLTGWVDDIEEATKITTENGKVSAYGFDRDIETYQVLEYAAPEGYSLNGDAVTAVWQDPTKDITIAQKATATIVNTKLISLPHTGGSGTAAFTGCGVLLMSVAAGLFFSGKKNKSAK